MFSLTNFIHHSFVGEFLHSFYAGCRCTHRQERSKQSIDNDSVVVNVEIKYICKTLLEMKQVQIKNGTNLQILFMCAGENFTCH